MTTPPDPEMRQRFLQGMSHTASTVNVVTTDGQAGCAGVTVSAMSSVSADGPAPTMLVCVHHKSPAAQAIVENGVFCINVLRDDQSEISDTFAGRIKTADGDKFSCTDWQRGATGAPRVADAMVAFDCRMISGERVGTHHVFIGEVADIHLSKRGSPLIFSNRSYGMASPIEHEVAHNRQDDNLPRLAIGCYYTFGPYVVPSLLKQMIEDRGAMDVRLVEGDEYRIAKALKDDEVELAIVYDYELGDEVDRELISEVSPHVLLAEGHPLARKPSIDLAELVEHPLVLLDVPSNRDYFFAMFERAGLTPDIAWKSKSFEMVRGMVGHGFGYGLLCTKPASSMSYDGQALVTREISTEYPANRVVLATHRSNQLSEPAQQFRQLCIDFFREE